MSRLYAGQHIPEKSPFERGYEDGLAGKPGPAFPTPDSPWAERLYNRGWERGRDARDAS